MKLNLYVNEYQLRIFLHGQAVENARARYSAVKWARNWWYPVSHLPLTDERVQGPIANALNFDINTKQWVPLSEVLSVWPYSRQRFFQVVNEGHIDRMEIPTGKTSFWIYRKEDVKMYLGDYAMDGRLKKAVDDMDTFMTDLEKW